MSMQKITAVFVLVLATLPPLVASADEASWDFSANVELQTRIFSQDARWPGQDRQDGQFSVAATAEFRWRNGEGNQ